MAALAQPRYSSQNAIVVSALPLPQNTKATLQSPSPSRQRTCERSRAAQVNWRLLWSFGADDGERRRLISVHLSEPASSQAAYPSFAPSPSLSPSDSLDDSDCPSCETRRSLLPSRASIQAIATGPRHCQPAIHRSHPRASSTTRRPKEPSDPTQAYHYTSNSPARCASDLLDAQP